MTSFYRLASPDRHPRDEWVDISCIDDLVPRYVLAVDGREVEIEEAKQQYVHGRIDADELEQRVEKALT